MDDAPSHLPARLLAARAAAAEVGFLMSCEDRTGALLRTLAASKPAGHILEIGTGVGAGAVWMLDGMDAASRLVSIEIDEDCSKIAQQVLTGDDRVTLVVDDAADWLATYIGPAFDMVFVDWRSGKYEHRNRLLAHLAPGALYVGDDLLPQPTWPDDHPQRVERFLGEIATEPTLAVTVMSWASGLIVAGVRSDPT